MTSSLVAVVLAAGGSTRLGRPKQLLTRDGETLVHRAARLAVASGAARVRVIVGAHADDVVAAVRDLPVECLVNPRWNEGLAGSVRVAVNALAAHDRATLLLTCDQPVRPGGTASRYQATSGAACSDALPAARLRGRA
mgnify:CR=1 FL=1